MMGRGKMVRVDFCFLGCVFVSPVGRSAAPSRICLGLGGCFVFWNHCSSAVASLPLFLALLFDSAYTLSLSFFSLTHALSHSLTHPVSPYLPLPFRKKEGKNLLNDSRVAVREDIESGCVIASSREWKRAAAPVKVSERHCPERGTWRAAAARQEQKKRQWAVEEPVEVDVEPRLKVSILGGDEAEPY